MKNFACFAVVLALIAVASAAINCNQNACSKQGQTHTMCLYKSPNPAAACGTVKSASPTEAEKRAIVDYHNKMRNFVASGQEKRGSPGPQPPASNMQNLRWDNELAEIATRWAIQCQFGHDRCRNVDRFSVGQNVATASTGGQDDITVEKLMKMWYDEVAKFDRNQVSNFRDYQTVGHYSQMIWADTSTIGCGLVRYNKDGWNHAYFVCNYGPTGNWMGGKVYKIRT